MTIASILVGDEPAVQARLQRILITLGHAAEALHWAGTIADGKIIAETHACAMALVDLGLPDGNGVDLVGWLRARSDSMPILVISAWSTEEMILAALRAGASGYVLKERDDVEIAVSLKSAMQGGAPIDPFIARRILHLLAPPAAAARAIDDADLETALTARELDILHRVADGMSNREIAAAVSLSPWTVASHVRAIYRKFAAHSRTPAVRPARARGLLR